ncbi:MAG: Zn-ribbon domain-containing OB-fold protein [Burkholderiaceae bacterium]
MTDNVKPWEADPFSSAYPETTEFWAAAAEGRLLLKTCSDCGKAHWYPRAVCPMCGSTKLSWVQASGKGKVYAFSPARRARPTYTLAYVTLDEGPTLMTNIIDAEPESLQIGQAVQVRFLPADEGRMMPFFSPV